MNTRFVEHVKQYRHTQFAHVDHPLASWAHTHTLNIHEKAEKKINPGTQLTFIWKEQPLKMLRGGWEEWKWLWVLRDD